MAGPGLLQENHKVLESCILAFSVALLSMPHCVCMCGSITCALSYASAPPDAALPLVRRAATLIILALGKATGYGIAGLLAHYFGNSFFHLLNLTNIHFYLRLATSLWLILIGFYIAGWYPAFAQVERLGTPLWARLQPWINRLYPLDHEIKLFTYGILWGWLPCGLIYTMLLGSLAMPQPLDALLYMFSFGLGTLPVLLAMSLLTGHLYLLIHHPLYRFLGGLAIVLLGLLSLSLVLSDHF